MSERFIIDIDTTDADSTLKSFDAKVKNTVNDANNVMEYTEQKSKMTFNRVLAMARMGWSAMDQIFQAFGINLGEQFRLLMQASFSAISTLQAIFTAEASNPYTAAFGAISLAELGLAMLAMYQASVDQQELSMQTAKTARAVFSVGSMIGSMSFMY